MSTANFRSLEGFPLYAFVEDQESDAFDEFESAYKYGAINTAAQVMNEYLYFHQICARPGYYEGVQFYVEEKFEHSQDWSDWDNEDTHYYFDMCRSKTVRKYNSEVNRLKREMKKRAKELDMQEFTVAARFSNGETWYSRKEL